MPKDGPLDRLSFLLRPFLKLPVSRKEERKQPDDRQKADPAHDALQVILIDQTAQRNGAKRTKPKARPVIRPETVPILPGISSWA